MCVRVVSLLNLGVSVWGNSIGASNVGLLVMGECKEVELVHYGCNMKGGCPFFVCPNPSDEDG